MEVKRRADVVIVGGAIIGSAVATFLAMRPDWSGRIVVAERDPTYRTASTTLSAASIRLQFSTPLNIEISRFGVEFLKSLDRWLAVDGASPPAADFIEGGYLFLATSAGMPTLLANHAIQRERGVDVLLLDPEQLRTRFPWLHGDDLAGGSLGVAGEGWFDAHALLQSFRRKARDLGVEYVTGTVVGIDCEGAAVTGVRLADGSCISTALVVDAAGPRAAEVAAMAGLELPVRPRKRHVYHFDCRQPIGPTPLTVLPSGIYFRPEGEAWIAGYSPRQGEPDPDTLDLEPDRAFFDEFMWPGLAAYVPAFEAVRLLDTWAGHYEVNTLDHNAVIGPHPELPGFLFANGFSGHGLQQAPAVGRGLAELIATGRYETLDLSPLGYERIRRNQPIVEVNVL